MLLGFTLSSANPSFTTYFTSSFHLVRFQLRILSFSNNMEIFPFVPTVLVFLRNTAGKEFVYGLLFP